MGLEIRAEALSLLLGCAMGAGLGLLYDLLRPIRHRTRAWFWDLLFCLCAAGSAFLFAMRSESGVLGTGELLMSFLGMFSYFRLLSPVFLPLFDAFVTEIGVFLVNTQVLIKKVGFFAKKLFHNLQG